mgnify:CR=1 FL=1
MKRFYSIFAIAALMLFGTGATLFAQGTTDSDLSKTGATGWIPIYDGFNSSRYVGYCDVTVTVMPSGSYPGFVTITGSHMQATSSKWYVSAYFTDKSGRKFLVHHISSNAFTSSSVEEIWLNYYVGTYFTGSKPYNTFDYDFEIASNAFKGCSSLQKFGPVHSSSTDARYIDCTRIGADAFNGCSAMTDCRVKATKDGVISARAFSGCSSLSSALFLSGSIDKTAFEGCTSVKTIYWYSGDAHAYSSASESPMYPMRNSVETITIYGNVPAHFFENFTALKEVKSPSDFFDSMKYTNIYQMGVGEKGFGSCSNLTSVQVAGAIHPDAFASCPKLTSVTYRGGYLSNSQVPTSENGSFFYACRSTVTSFTIEETSTTNVPNAYIPSYLCYGMSKLTSVTIPNYVFAIGEGAFKSCSALKSVSINSKNSELSVIGSYAFQDCSSLSNITLPVALEYLYDEAFSWCESMSFCPLAPENTKLKYIGHAAFYNAGLTYLYIPAGVTKIGGMLTGGSKSDVTQISFMPANLDRSGLIDGSWADLFISTKDMYANERKAVTEIRISDSRTEIPDSLFYNYTGLVQVVNDGGSANLSKVTSVGKAAFRNCTSMWGGGNQTQMPNLAVAGEAAFEGSNYNGSADFDKLTTIGKRAFANTQLMYLHDMGTLSELKTISEEAFADNTKLASATFAGVTTIGTRAFANDAKLETINISKTAPAIQSNSFAGCSVKTIKTACSVYNDIKNDANWQAVCANIQSSDNSYKYPSYMDDFWCTKTTMEIVQEINCDGVFVVRAVPYDGCTFLYWHDGTTDNPRTVDMNEYYSSWLYAISASDDDYHTTNFTVVPENAGWLQITNQYGHNRNNQKFPAGETAKITPMELNGWYEFDEWQYETGDMMEAPYVCDEEKDPLTLCVSINYTFDAGGGEEGGYIDPETGEWMPGEPVMPEEVPMFDENLKAVFKPKAVPVTVERCTDGNGSVEVSEAYSNVGSTITLTATPKEGFVFDQWEDGNKETNRKLTITPEMLIERAPMGWDPEMGDMAYNEYPVDMGGGSIESYHSDSEYILRLCAKFKVDPNIKKTYTILASANDPTMGTVSGSGEYDEGTSVTLTATANSGYKFTEWSDGEKTNPRTITVTENLVLTAVFVEDSQTQEGDAYVCDFSKMASKHQQYTDQWTYDDNWTVFGAANNNAGWPFAKFGGKDTNLEKANPVYVVNNAALDKEIKQVRVTYPVGSFGKNGMSMNSWGVKVYSDLECTNLLYTVQGGEFGNDYAVLTVSAKEGNPWLAGYAIQVYWDLVNTTTTNGIVWVEKIEYLTEAVQEDVYFTIVVESSNPEAGTVTGNGEYKQGSTAEIKAIPNNGYEFAQWSDGNTDNPRTITVTEDATYVASFKEINDALKDIFGNDQPQVRKEMIDGVIYIIKDGRRYNVLGVEVK